MLAATATPRSAPVAAAKPVVQIRKLWTVFGRGDQAFSIHQDLDLDVYQGEILTLVGGSGTGKSVLLRQILGLLQPAKGEVLVQGTPVQELSRQGAASRIGMLFQQGALFSAFNVLENIPFRSTSKAPCRRRWCAMRPWSSCRWWASSPSTPRACLRTCRAA